MKIGIIGGSGLYSINGFEFIEDIEVSSAFGKPSSPYKLFRKGGVEFYFLSRHGANHTLAPHKVNYRANIDGFKQIGVSQILSFNAVGGIASDLKPSDIVIPDNAIDMTCGRANTFYEENDIVHIDLTYPFCETIRDKLITLSKDFSFGIKNKGVYVCTNGPRLETAAEIKMYKTLGADIVGMTLFPEVTLAREAEICYANVSIVTNFAAGISENKLTTSEVIETIKKSEEKLKEILELYSKNIPNTDECKCTKALEDAGITKK